jgi:hypothetical protein
LIGVEEVKGGRSIVSGIPPGNHLDDHSLQQFVCSKTNRPVPFSYAPFVTGGVEIGVLTIPLPDQRPFYLIDNCGRLERNVVYIRRGSSTGEATPDEVLKMAANSAHPVGQPVLQLDLVDPETREKLGSVVEVRPLLFNLPDPESLPIYGKAPVDFLGTRLDMSTDNNDYYKDVAEYVRARGTLCGIGFCVSNSSTTFADTVVVTLELESSDLVVVIEESDLPAFPSCNNFSQIAHHLGPHGGRLTTIGAYGQTLEVKVQIGNVQPGRTEYSAEPLFISSEVACGVSMKATISANNLRLPVSSTIEIKITPLPRDVTVAQIVGLGDDRR